MRILHNLTPYLNPFDHSLQTGQNFASLSLEKKVAVLFVTTVVTIATVGIASIFTFRLFTYLLSPTALKTDQVAKRTLPYQKTPEEEEIEKAGFHLPSLWQKHGTTEISERTLQEKSLVENYLNANEIGKLGAADDTGDCFYHSMAQLLSRRLGKRISTKDVKMRIANYLEELEKREGTVNWVSRAMRDRYEEYKQLVGLTFEELIDHNNALREQKKALFLDIIQRQKRVERLTHNLETTRDKENIQMEINVEEYQIEKRKKEVSMVSEAKLPFWGEISVDDQILAACYDIPIECYASYESIQMTRTTGGDQTQKPLVLAKYGQHFVPVFTK